MVEGGIGVNWEQSRNIIAAMGGAVAIVAALWKLQPVIRQWWDRRTLLELSREAYSADDAGAVNWTA